MPTPLDNDKETHGFLPELWACFSRKFGDYRFSEMPLPALKNIIGIQVKSPDNVMSLLIDEQEV